MTAIGRFSLSFWLIACFAVPAWAELTATVDRNRVALGDTLRLTVTATGSDSLEQLDLKPLARDFDLLQRSTSSSTSMFNGSATHVRQLLIDMTPKRQGTLQIPALKSRTGSTNMILVAVGPPAAAGDANSTVIFEAEVDRHTAYVQSQIVLTLRIQQAINLDSRSLSDLQVDNAFVTPLEQKSFQRTVNGQQWLVTEVRYAIFPEKSGDLVIPAQRFSARETDPRRSRFSIRGSGRQLQRRSEELRITVLPRPDSYPTGTWLPAQQLQLEEHWSSSPEELRAGESITRSIVIRAEGLQGAQLPPLNFELPAALQSYPDQPQISDREVSSGVLGERSDSTAIIATVAGEWEIPELRIPWWDTTTDSLQFAVIPARKVTALAVPSLPGASTDPTTAPLGDAPALTTGQTPSEHAGYWPVLSAITSIGWLLTVAYVIYLRRSRPASMSQPQSAKGTGNAEAAQLLKTLLTHCDNNDATASRDTLQRWCCAQLEQPQLSLEQALLRLNSEALTLQARALDAALYSENSSSWQGATLAAALRAFNQSKEPAQAGQTSSVPPLYPMP